MNTKETGFTLAIKDHPWTEDTENQVDFIVKTLALTGKERILDLACGFGRHSLALARRGFSVVGVDLTKELIEDARRSAQAAGLSIEFIHADILDLTYESAFDVALNLADGAIGYFEEDEENLRFFDVISRALKPGGKHFMDLCNAEHAALYFPKRHWMVGSKMISLPEFDWDPVRRRMLFTDWGLTFGEAALPPEGIEKDTGGTRLYTQAELSAILTARGMRIVQTFSDYYGRPATPRALQLMTYSVKD